MALLMVPASPLGIEFDSYAKRYFIIIIIFCFAWKTCSWFSLAHKHKDKHNISIRKWEHPRHKHMHKQKNEPTYLPYAVVTRA